MNENLDIHIVDYMDRLIPDVIPDASDERRMQMPNMDFASLYPSPMRNILNPSFNSVIESEKVKTAEDYINAWEESQELSLRWGNFSFPIVERIAARTLGQDLVSVQPMVAPQGILHYIDYVYQNNEEGVVECPIGNIIDEIQKEEGNGTDISE